MTVTKLGLYNDALRRAGAERLASETEAVEVRYKLDDIWTLGAVDVCLRIAKPVFARKTANSTTLVTTSTHGLQYVHTLPSDYVGMVGDEKDPSVYSDANLDEPVRRYIIEGDSLYSEFATVYFRYVSDVSATFTNWSADFANVVAAYLAKELATRVNSAKKGELNDQFDLEVATSEAITRIEEPPRRAQKTDTTLSQDWLAIYNDALAILMRPRLTSLNDERQDRVALDTARESRVVEGILAERGWYFADTVVQIDYNTHLEPAWGYAYAFTLPQDMLTINGVFADEYLTNPVARYRVEKDILFCDSEQIYLQYVKDDVVLQPSSWPAPVRRYIGAALADEAMGQIPELTAAAQSNVDVKLMRRKHDAETYDGRNRPPQMIRHGNWTRTRQGFIAGRYGSRNYG